MRIRPLLHVACIAALAAMCSIAAIAQGVGYAGNLRGTVTDPKGAVVANATVTITGTENGFTRTVTTNEDGAFVALNMPPGVYNVKVDAGGFQTATIKDVSVAIGQDYTTDIKLNIAGTTTSVDVNADQPVVDTGQAQQANRIDNKLISDLPINRRDYLTFTLLAPAVSDSTRLASDQDFRVKQTPQSGLSFYGSNGRGNTVTVDGAEANDDSGGVRGTLSQDSVYEFQINRSNYLAELGGASGAAINIVSKSGTNTKHGSAFGFFRNQGLDARNPFSYAQALAPGAVFDPAAPNSSGTPVKDKLSRQQIGGSYGFAIKPDKTFLYLSAEILRQNAQNAVPLLTSTNIFRPNSGQQTIINGLAALGATLVPCLTGQPALPAATCAGILQNILTISNVPAASALNKYVVGLFENNGGIFPYRTRQYQFAGRFDTHSGQNNQYYLRYNFSQDREQNPDVQSLTGFSRGSATFGRYHNFAGAWFHQFSAETSNEFRAQYSHTNFNVDPNVLGQVGLDVPGFGSFGNQIFIPNHSILNRYEFADNLTHVMGDHVWKFGFYELLRGNDTISETFFPGRFVFGNLPGGVLSPCLQVPAACGLTSNPAVINSIQSVALGLPQFYQQGFGLPEYKNTRPFTAFFAEDSWNVRPNLMVNLGLRYELDTQYGTLHTDTNNFAPRFSFSWDPFKDHKTVIRGGYGLFYSQVYAQIPNVVQTLGNINNARQIANYFVSLRGGIPGNPTLTSAAIFQTLFAQGKVQCSSPPAGAFACITPADLVQFGINVTNTGALPPFTVTFSGQPDYQNPVSQQMEIGVERQIGRAASFSASYIHVHTTHLPVAIDTNLLGTAPIATDPVTGGTFRNWAAAQCTATPTSCFANPLVLQSNVYSSIASALYDGFIFEFRGGIGKRMRFMSSYTWSKAKDDSTDFNSDYSPVDQTNLRGEWSLSDFDQRHKFVFASTIDAPWGLQLSPIVRANSGHPFNLLAGSDLNGDRHSTNDRPLAAGRNTGIGPNYFSVDLRLARSFRINEKTHIDFIADGFNIFNRTNFASVNNVVGNIAGPYSLRGNRALSPSQPLGFTSTYPKRQIQLGAKLVF